MNTMISAAIGLSALLLLIRGIRLFRPAFAGWMPDWLDLLVCLPVAGYLLQRSLAAGFPAFSGTTAVLSLLVLLLIPGGFFLAGSAGKTAKTTKTANALRFQLLAAAAGLLLAGQFPGVLRDPAAPVPALRSGWLLLHVGAVVAGEALFLLAAIAAAGSLAASRRGARSGSHKRAGGTESALRPEGAGSRDYSTQHNKDRPEADGPGGRSGEDAAQIHEAQLFRISRAAVYAGYPLFTLGALVFGALWAYQAWGRYWAWDPKEVWALATWMLYSLYLHADIAGARRLGAAGKRRLLNVLALLGILLAAFTFFGVNLLFNSVHAY
ncbi:cytochrome c biogenesis protein [Spirochaeta dissipatitropha]